MVVRLWSCAPRTLALALVASALVAIAPLRAQGLREQLSGLFIFGAGQDPLFLAGSADPDNPQSIQVHGNHFVPSASAANGTLISFITDAIGGNVASVPLGATGGSETFRFEGGVPVRTSTSAGPIFAERAQTLGKGRVLAGISHSKFHYESLRGVDLNDIQLTFTHQNVNFPGCDTLFSGDCSKMGVPVFENDIMQFQLALNIDVSVTSVYVTYGVFDRLDIGVVVPFVSTDLQGQSSTQIIPFGGPTAAHFFAGTPENPVLSITRATSGHSFGLGDVSLRMKVNVHESPTTNVSLFGDARLPSGGEDDLLGAGFFSARGLAVISTRFGSFAPHLNAGYLYRHTNRQNDAVLGTLGFDQLLGERVTLAVDLVSQLQVGDSRLTLPGPVHYDAPFSRTISPTTIPNMRDDIFDGSFGLEFSAGQGLTIVANALFPLNKGGLRPGVSYTAGLEYTF
ncbi:MAG TPA: transporter [Gemmatimonadaceae bacterium]|nr:transporter [Gemmatimonadaceae bacterium]